MSSFGTALKPALWNLVQLLLGAPDFKRQLYASVLHPPGKLLDFGCATGHIAEVFLEFEYYGIDLDADAIEAAKSRFRKHHNAHFVVCDIRSRPFEANFFDEILLAGTVHHLADEQLTSILKELNFCLKPSGTLHIIDPVLQQNDGWQQRLMRRLDRGPYVRSFEQIKDLVDRVDLFDLTDPSLHKPYGALLQDCDFVHVGLHKKSVSATHKGRD